MKDKKIMNMLDDLMGIICDSCENISDKSEKEVCVFCDAYQISDKICEILKEDEEPSGGIKLKPCPFCGGEAEMHVNGAATFIACKECGSEIVHHESSGRMTYLSGLNTAIEKWNRRESNE